MRIAGIFVKKYFFSDVQFKKKTRPSLRPRAKRNPTPQVSRNFGISKPKACPKTPKRNALRCARLVMTLPYHALHESWRDFLIFVRGEDFINDDDG
jgi:hypothetical protein